MKRKLMSLLLAGSLALTLTACGGKDAPAQESAPTSTPSAPVSDAESTVSQPTVSDTTPAPSGDLPDGINFKISSTSNYGEGMAIMRFYDSVSKDSYFGLVDKSGVVRYCYNIGNRDGANLTEGTEFRDGIGYLLCEPMLYEIGPDGAVLRYFPYLSDLYISSAESGVEYAVAYGDGYIVTVTVESGFEGTSISYSVYDPQNNKTELFADSVKLDVKYLGLGNFRFRCEYYPVPEGYDPSKTLLDWTNIYCAPAQKWLADVGTTSLGESHRALDDYVVYSIFIDQVVEGMERAEGQRLVVCDREGTVTELELPQQPDTKNPLIIQGADDGMVAFQIGCTFYLGDLATGTVTPYTGKYADSVVPSGVGTNFKNGRIGVPLVGKDGKPYVVFLDRDMKEICEPVQMALCIRCTDDYILNLDGAQNQLSVFDPNNGFNVVFSVEAFNISIGDGVLHPSTKADYFQYDGTPLFQELDYSQAKLIDLPQ